MNEPINDGGPAFPVHMSNAMLERGSAEAFGLAGMSLRDWFAGQALSGFFAIPDNRTCPTERLHEIEAWRDEVALEDCKTVYRYANAMMKARGGQ